MIKPETLRRHLVAAIPNLRQNPDKLLVFADDGTIVAAGTASLSFEYRYRLTLILTDYTGDPDAVMVTLLAWVAENEYALLGNPEMRKSGISFEVDFNSHDSIDLSITLDLVERVVVRAGDKGRLDIIHPPEPQPAPGYAHPVWHLYSGDSLLAQWHVTGTPS